MSSYQNYDSGSITDNNIVLDPQTIDGAADIFDKGQKSRKQAEAQTDELFRQIGQLKVENDFLSRKLSS